MAFEDARAAMELARLQRRVREAQLQELSTPEFRALVRTPTRPRATTRERTRAVRVRRAAAGSILDSSPLTPAPVPSP